MVFFINLYKQPGISSAGILNRLKKVIGQKKLGHAGTLDPFAEGVLPVAIGKATKLLSYLLLDDKRYIFELYWGKETDTLDSTGEVINVSQNKVPTLKELQEVLLLFKGEIEQIPPKYSAIKIDGKRSYELARAGVEVDLEYKKRMITIFDLEILEHDIDNKKTKLSVHCSTGTYVRSLARDIAHYCNNLSYVQSLQRVSVGKDFQIKNALTIEEIASYISMKNEDEIYINADDVMHMPKIILNEAEIKDIIMGRAIILDHLSIGADEREYLIKMTENSIKTDQEFMVKLSDGKYLVAIAKINARIIQPVKVFADL